MAFHSELEEFQAALQQLMNGDSRIEGRFTRAYTTLLPTMLQELIATEGWDDASLGRLWEQWLAGQLALHPTDRAVDFAVARCIAEGLVLRRAVGFDLGSEQAIIDRLTEFVP